MGEIITTEKLLEAALTRVEPQDLLIIQFPGRVPPENLTAMSAQIGQAFPGMRVMVFDQTTRVEVLRAVDGDVRTTRVDDDYEQRRDDIDARIALDERLARRSQEDDR